MSNKRIDRYDGGGGAVPAGVVASSQGKDEEQVLAFAGGANLTNPPSRIDFNEGRDVSPQGGIANNRAH